MYDDVSTLVNDLTVFKEGFCPKNERSNFLKFGSKRESGCNNISVFLM